MESFAQFFSLMQQNFFLHIKGSVLMHWHRPALPKKRLRYLKDNEETILAGAIDPTVL